MQHQTDREIVRSEFISHFKEKPRLYQAPGRINIIGEHTDYNGGFVLPSTVDLFTWAAAAPRDDRELHVYVCHGGSKHRIDLDSLVRGEHGEVAEYLKGVAWALGEEGVSLRGCNVVIGGNIPIGGGLSSSASLELVLALALLSESGLEMNRDRMARACQRAEADFVGVQCGIMDQYSVALGARGRALILDCRSLHYDLLPISDTFAFLLIHSGVSHRLPAGDYNSRRDECSEATGKLQAALPRLQLLRDLGLEQLENHRDLLSGRLYRRCRHVVTENRRVLEARVALESAGVTGLGFLMSQSHASLRDDYEVSCPELDRLVDIAHGCEGVFGSRMMGGGFGGCTISLVQPEAMEDVAERIRTEYGRELGTAPWMHRVGPAGPVSKMED